MPSNGQHFDYPAPAVDRFEVRVIPAPVYLFYSRCCSGLLFLLLLKHATPVGHKKITEPINAVRRFTDALVGHRQDVVELIVLLHCPGPSCMLSQLLLLLLLLLLFQWMLASVAVARASWLLAPVSFLPWLLAAFSFLLTSSSH